MLGSGSTGTVPLTGPVNKQKNVSECHLFGFFNILEGKRNRAKAVRGDILRFSRMNP